MRNFSYSLIPILLKLNKCCDHALKICMWFGYNSQINFCHFFLLFELGNFLGILSKEVNGQWVPCVHNTSYRVMRIALKLYLCYRHVLKICMWFGYNLRIIFCHFELSHFFGHFSEWIEGTLRAQLIQRSYRHGDHALKICMWLGYTPQINLCHFFFAI